MPLGPPELRNRLIYNKFVQTYVKLGLTAVAQQKLCVGTGWLPVPGVTLQQAKALAVFLNSTPGRLQLMRNAGKNITYPQYNPAASKVVRVPNVTDERTIEWLARCWEQTTETEVPQYRDGDCEVRRLWDEAVAEALCWDAAELERLRRLLHAEPHVRGLGYGQYADAVELDPADRQRFTELADRWEMETMLESNTAHAVEHPAHKEIISMGESVVPLILERMRGERGHWFFALRAITGDNPVKPADRGKVAVMEQAWLQWGEVNGYV